MEKSHCGLAHLLLSHPNWSLPSNLLLWLFPSSLSHSMLAGSGEERNTDLTRRWTISMCPVASIQSRRCFTASRACCLVFYIYEKKILQTIIILVCPLVLPPHIFLLWDLWQKPLTRQLGFLPIMLHLWEAGFQTLCGDLCRLCCYLLPFWSPTFGSGQSGSSSSIQREFACQFWGWSAHWQWPKPRGCGVGLEDAFSMSDSNDHHD